MKITLVSLIILSSIIMSSCTSIDKNNRKNASAYFIEKVDTKNFVIEDSAYINDGMLLVTNGEEGNKKRYGYIDVSGKLKISPVYRGTVSFSNGLAFVSDDSGKGYYIDKEGKIVIDHVDGKSIVGDIFKDGYARARMGYIINTKGEVQLSPGKARYDYHNLGNGFFKRLIAPNYLKFNIVDVTGKVIFSNGADLILPSKDGNGFYTYDYQVYGVLSNNEFQKPLYKFIYKFADNRALVVDLNGMVKLINSGGKVLVNFSSIYPNIDNNIQNIFSDGVAALNFKDSKNAIIIDTKGNVVKETDFSFIRSFENGVAVGMKNGKYGYVDTSGNAILEPIYDVATNYSDGVGFVKKGKQWYRFVYKYKQ